MNPASKSVLIAAEGDDIDAVHMALTEVIPEIPVYVEDDDFDPKHIAYAAVWFPRPGLLASLPNLEAIFSLGAGIDHILNDPQVPASVPIVRMVHGKTREQMRDYVVHAVLHYYRMMDIAADLQTRRLWQFLHLRDKSEFHVGFLGLGEMGSFAARTLVDMGFKVRGWARSKKSVPGVDCFLGEDGLSEMLSLTDCLVSILPATPQTAGCLNTRVFNTMPRGSFMINIGRGNHVAVGDLLSALDSGHLAGATLDVFDQEPLALDSPLWTHPKIRVTPHIAGFGDARTVATAISDNIRRMKLGLPPIPTGDRLRGY
jgi:glyoxylate/hydroxypyruvate reductase